MIIEDFFIYSLTVKRCLQIKNYNISGIDDDDPKKWVLMFFIFTDFSYDETLRRLPALNARDYATLKGYFYIILESVKNMTVRQIYQLLYNINGGSFQNCTSLLDITMLELEHMAGIISEQAELRQKNIT